MVSPLFKTMEFLLDVISEETNQRSENNEPTKKRD